MEMIGEEGRALSVNKRDSQKKLLGTNNEILEVSK